MRLNSVYLAIVKLVTSNSVVFQERLASSYLSCLKNAPYSTPVAFASFLLSGESTTLSGILDVSIISGHNVQSSLKLSFNTTYEDTSSVSIGSPVR